MIYTIFKSIVFVLVLIGSIISWLLFSNDYLSVINFIQKRYPEVYDIDKIHLFFTFNQFVLLRSWVLFVTLLQLSLFLGSIKYDKVIISNIEKFRNLLLEIIKKIISQFVDFSFKEKIILIVCCTIVLAHHIYLMLEIAIGVDDVSSFVFCSSQGPLVSGIFYHEANNHIFYSIICSLLYMLHLPASVVMIMPSSISFILILVIVFAFVRSQAGFKAACIAIILAGLLPLFLIFQSISIAFPLITLSGELITETIKSAGGAFDAVVIEDTRLLPSLVCSYSKFEPSVLIKTMKLPTLLIGIVIFTESV